jgi:hypothetical protein
MIRMQKYFLFLLIISFVSLLIFYIDYKLSNRNPLALINDYIFNYSSSSSLFMFNTSKSKAPKWIVVTTINNPTKQLDKLAEEKEFKLVVVADLKTDKSWSHGKKSVYLDVNTQKNLNYSSFQTTPFNSYTRKNIGYLYAIQNGARFIYDTDDDNQPILNLIDYFDFDEYKQELEYDLDSPGVINPYAHFGQPTIWPRGFPLSAINKRLYNDYVSMLRPTSIIQQSVVNGDPDVDAIFRLTKTLDYKRIDIKFDDSSPTVRIPLYKITPFNSQNTLFHYKAFWALYLPSTVSFRLTDIWRSYWCQRLIWMLDSTVSFLGPNAYQLRNSHSYLSDYKQEKEMYLKTEDLIKLLYSWKCPFKKFYSCVIDLSEQMATNNFWDKKEVESIKNWLKDLDSVNYIEPTITNFNYETNQNAAKTISYNNAFKVRYTPRFETLIDIDNFYGKGEVKMKNLEKLKTINYLNHYCGPYKLNYDTENLSKSINQQDITLLITFNHEPILNNIIFLKEFHQSYFKNIVFCGSKILKIVKTSDNHLKKFDSYSLIDYDTNEGILHYHCMSKLIDINYKTNGILLMSDDVLLKHWNLNTNHESIWYATKPSCINDLNSDKNWGKDYWIRKRVGVEAINRTYNLIEGIASGKINSDKQTYTILNKFLINFNLKQNETSKKLKKICKSESDIFYVPKSVFIQFNLLSRMYSSNNVFLEYAVSSILLGLDAPLEVLNGLYYWKPSKFDIGLDYFKHNHFAHPFKLSYFDTFKKRKDVCQTYIADKLKYF